LAGSIAHEFNNILTAITGNLLLAKMYAKPELEVYDILSEAEKAAHRAESLTRQLLTFSKGGTLFKKGVPATGLMKSLVDSLSSEGGVRFEVSIEEDLPLLNLDEGQIRQAINNLILNARQAMPDGGTIRLRAENVLSEGDAPLSMKAGKYVKISVEDQGTGIEGALMEKIFDPFFTTKKKSSGLGLTSAYSVIRNHDGYITVESSIGSGTTFHVYIPAVTDRIPVFGDEDKIFYSDRKKVLVMDDEEIVRTVIERMLAQCGCETEFAADGREMLRLYREAMDAGRPFDAVIIDLVVAAGMGGKEAIKELLLIDPGARAVVSSGYSDDLIMSDYRNYGFRGVLAKPYKITKLSRVLLEVMSA